MSDSNKVKQAVETKGKWYLKALWWGLGFVALVGVVVGIVCLIKRKGPVTAAKDVAETTAAKVRAIDAEAKVKAAEAAGVETVVVKEIERAAMIEDDYERAKRLAELALEDW
jgi:hypothetical protein